MEKLQQIKIINFKKLFPIKFTANGIFTIINISLNIKTFRDVL